MKGYNRIGDNKAPGLDGIQNVVLKTSMPTISELFMMSSIHQGRDVSLVIAATNFNP